MTTNWHSMLGLRWVTASPISIYYRIWTCEIRTKEWGEQIATVLLTFWGNKHTLVLMLFPSLAFRGEVNSPQKQKFLSNSCSKIDSHAHFSEKWFLTSVGVFIGVLAERWERCHQELLSKCRFKPSSQLSFDKGWVKEECSVLSSRGFYFPLM